jgi:hypothetical protein
MTVDAGKPMITFTPLQRPREEAESGKGRGACQFAPARSSQRQEKIRQKSLFRRIYCMDTLSHRITRFCPHSHPHTHIYQTSLYSRRFRFSLVRPNSILRCLGSGPCHIHPWTSTIAKTPPDIFNTLCPLSTGLLPSFAAPPKRADFFFAIRPGWSPDPPAHNQHEITGNTSTDSRHPSPTLKWTRFREVMPSIGSPLAPVFQHPS